MWRYTTQRTTVRIRQCTYEPQPGKALWHDAYTVWHIVVQMESIPIEDVLLVETKDVSEDGRVYIGREHAGKEVKLLVLDEETSVPSEN